MNPSEQQAPEPDELPFATAPFARAVETWPTDGRVLLAPFDDEGVWLFATFGPGALALALETGRFGPGYDLTRPRAFDLHLQNLIPARGWSVKLDDSDYAAVRISRAFFDELIAVGRGASPDSKLRVELAWQPCRDPLGAPIGCRVPRLVLEGEALRRMYRIEPQRIVDVTRFVHQQVETLLRGGVTNYAMPLSRRYPLDDDAAV